MRGQIILRDRGVGQYYVNHCIVSIVYFLDEAHRGRAVARTLGDLFGQLLQDIGLRAHLRSTLCDVLQPTHNRIRSCPGGIPTSRPPMSFRGGLGLWMKVNPLILLHRLEDLIKGPLCQIRPPFPLLLRNSKAIRCHLSLSPNVLPTRESPHIYVTLTRRVKPLTLPEVGVRWGMGR